MGLEDGKELERQQCCGLDMVDVRRIFLEAIEAKSLNEEKKINGKKRSFREWLYFIGKQVDYEFWKGGRGGKRKIIVNKKNISWLIEGVKKEVSNDDLVLEFLKPFSENFNRQDKYKPNLLRCLLSKCKNWVEVFGKFKSIIKKVSKNPGIVDYWIEHPTENPLNEEIKIGKATYSMAQWILFFLHLAGFETYLSGLWKAVKDNWEKAVLRLELLFAQIYWDSKVEQVIDATAPEIAEAVGDTPSNSGGMESEEIADEKAGPPSDALEEWIPPTEIESESEADIAEPMDDFSPEEGNQQIEEPHNEKEENQPNPPILVTPLMASDDPLLNRREKIVWILLYNILTPTPKWDQQNYCGLNKDWSKNSKKIALYIDYMGEILNRRFPFFVLEWISGKNADRKMKEKMQEGGYAILEDGRFAWEDYLEDVERYFNFAPWWNEFLGKVMEKLTLWRKYIIFVNLYLIWNLWWEKSPDEREKEFEEEELEEEEQTPDKKKNNKSFEVKVKRFLKEGSSIRAWEVLTWLLKKGYSDEEIKSFIKKRPGVLTRNLERLESIRKWLEEKWFNEDQIKSLINRQLRILSFTSKTIELIREWLEGKWFDREEVKSFIKERPNILTRNPKGMESTWKWLKEKWFNEDQIKSLINRQLRILDRNAETIEVIWRWFEEKWFDEDEIKKIINKKSRIFSLSNENLDWKWKWFEEKWFDEVEIKELLNKYLSVLISKRATLEKRRSYLEQKLWLEDTQRFILNYPVLLSINIQNNCSGILSLEDFKKCLRETANAIIRSSKPSS